MGFANPQVPSRNLSGVSDRDRERGTGQRGSAEKESGVNAKTGWPKKAISMGSPEDNEEALYEYFPLSLDDWLVLPFRYRTMNSLSHLIQMRPHFNHKQTKL